MKGLNWENRVVTETQSRLEDLLNAAYKDPEVKREFLTRPAEMAEEWGIKLEEGDVARMAKLGVFIELAREARMGSMFSTGDPYVWYASHFWLQQEIIELLSELIHPTELPSVVQDKLNRTLYLGQNRGNQGRN